MTNQGDNDNEYFIGRDTKQLSGSNYPYYTLDSKGYNRGIILHRDSTSREVRYGIILNAGTCGGTRTADFYFNCRFCYKEKGIIY